MFLLYLCCSWVILFFFSFSWLASDLYCRWMYFLLSWRMVFLCFIWLFDCWWIFWIVVVIGVVSCCLKAGMISLEVVMVFFILFILMVVVWKFLWFSFLVSMLCSINRVLINIVISLVMWRVFLFRWCFFLVLDIGWFIF